MSGACGPCTVCCSVMGVVMDPLPLGKKPPRTPCQYQRKGGCSIYMTRPTSCRVFSCLWLATQDMDESMAATLRPDRSHVVLELNSAQNIVAHCRYPAAWKREPMLSFLMGVTARGVLNMTAVAAVEAQERAGRQQPTLFG